MVKVTCKFTTMMEQSGANHVYVRKDGKESGLCVVYNDTVPLRHDMKVTVGKGKNHPRQWRVIGTAGASPMGEGVTVNTLAPHGDTHRYLANDTVYVDIRAFTNLGVYVTNPESLYVTVFRGYVWTGTAYILVATQTVNLTAHVPSTAGKAALVLITVASDGSIATTKGSEVDLADLTITDCPGAPAGTLKRSAAVRVYAGQTKIIENSTDGSDIVDLRFADPDNILPVYTNDVSDPPTDAELDSAIGAPAGMGAGFAALLDDAGAGTKVYLITSDGANWWYQLMTKAA